jgi:hypothetical protein
MEARVCTASGALMASSSEALHIVPHTIRSDSQVKLIHRSSEAPDSRGYLNSIQTTGCMLVVAQPSQTSIPPAYNASNPNNPKPVAPHTRPFFALAISVA